MATSELDLQGAIILIVDDVPANLDLLCHHLEAAAYQMLVASNGKRALELAAQVVPDLILLDVQMPGMDGFEVCRQFKQNPATQEIPVLFLTGLVEAGDRVEGFEAGGVDYIVKPYHSREILVRIRTHLEHARLAGIPLEKNRELERLRRELDWTNQVLQEEIIRALNPDL